MSKSELILEFIDGTLDSAVEQGLFQEMAQQPELRSELRQFINIGDAVRSDREAFVPPAHLERALMAGIGIAPTADSNNAVAGAVVPQGGGRFWMMTTSFVVGALMAASTVWLMMRGDDAASNQPVVAVQTAPATQSQTQPQAQAPQLQNGTGGDFQQRIMLATAIAPAATSANGSAERGVESEAGRERVRIKYVYLPAPQSKLSGGEEIPTSNGGGSNIASASTNTPANNNGGSGIASERSSNEAAAAADTLPRVAETTLLPISNNLGASASNPRATEMLNAAAVEVRPTQSMMLGSSSPLGQADDGGNALTIITEARYQFARNAIPTQALSPAYSIPENFAAGAYVKLSDAWYLGVEAGTERYAQTLLINRNDTLAIDQQPKYGWGGLAARYDFGAIPSLPARMYFQVTGGATSAGPLVRFRLGAPVQLTEGVALAPGFEFSSLVYMFNNQRLFSGRWGATVGTEFNLSTLLW